MRVRAQVLLYLFRVTVPGKGSHRGLVGLLLPTSPCSCSQQGKLAWTTVAIHHACCYSPNSSYPVSYTHLTLPTILLV
eukprot:3034895-Amphidinium_carterae.1